MNGKTKNENVKEMAWTVCKDFLGGAWQEISLEEFQLHEVSGGLSNTIYRCALPDDTTSKETEAPTEILLRIYGPMQDDPNVVIAEAVTFMLLSERLLGPKLYGLFPKGRLEEFIPSHSLSSDEIRQNSLLIACEMAKIHALDVPVKKMPNLFHPVSSKWLFEVQEVLHDDSDKYFMSFDEYAEEVKWIEQEMAKTKCPVVYCHNDLQGGNILFREDVTVKSKSIMLIDFEFGCYNYRSFDLANHFIEWCFDYATPSYPHFELDLDKFPSKEEQTEFLTVYLDQFSKENGKLEIPLHDEIDTILDEIPLFAGAACLLWSLWSAKMTLTSSFEIAHREHGKTRKNLYKKFKEEYLMSRR